VKQIFNWFPFL